ncbi:MAG: hypothetical protein ACYTG4_15690 [Planctomycetota bacterium]
MRKDILSAGAALASLIGVVVLLLAISDGLFGRHGPFDLRSVEEEWTGSDGEAATSRAEILTFRGEELFTVRAFDGMVPPELRTPPIPDSLNRVARSIGAGEAIPVIALNDVPGLDIEMVRRDTVTGREDFLIRITPEDAVIARAHGEASATVDGLAERWRAAVHDALRFVADSVAGGAREGAEPTGGARAPGGA